MTESRWHFAPSDDNRLHVTTGVTGRASKMGHRLTIAVSDWRADVEWTDDRPTMVEFTAQVDSFDVVAGEGGITPLLGPEKALARSNALKTLDAKRFAEIVFRADTVEQDADRYRLVGSLQIHGVRKEHAVEVRVEDTGASWRLSAQTVVRQTDFGVTPYSQMLGAMKVVDEVTVTFTDERRKP